MTLKTRVMAIDYKKVGKNALIFSAPALLLILTGLQAGRTPEELVNIVYLWFLNALVDLLRKFQATNQ